MRSYQKALIILLALAPSAAMLSGCQFHIPFGIGSFVTGERYSNAASYQTGGFTYGADQVTAVEICWRCGEVEIIQSEEDELHVWESGDGLPEDAAMHYLLEDGILRIQFCESGTRIHVQPNDKRLTIEVPKGIALSVRTSSAPVRADMLEQSSLLISAQSGRMELGTVDAGSVNLSSSSGAIRADRISAEALNCDTSSGSVRIDDLEADTAELDTNSGAVKVALSAVSQLDIHTSSGRTLLHLPEGGAEVSYSSSSGTLHTSEPFAQEGKLYVFGSGESRIAVHSSSGNLEIE